MPAAATRGRLSSDPLENLGVRMTPEGGQIRVWSANAHGVDLCVFDGKDPSFASATIPLTQDQAGVWSATTPALKAGTYYALRARGPKGPTHAFDATKNLLDPYARGLARTSGGEWRGYVQHDEFDWEGVAKPVVPLDHTVVYEVHVKGFTKLHPDIPDELRGTYAGLAHPAAIEYLKNLGVTTLELLPVHQSVSEQRLQKMGLVNYWGYNTLNFFTPHAGYATRAAQNGGTGAVLREFKGMVKLLHEAGLEVVLDVVYNHTAEEGRGRPGVQPARARQRVVLPTGRDGRLHRHHRVRQHDRLLAGGRAATRARLAAVLDERRADRRLPLRPDGDPRPR